MRLRLPWRNIYILPMAEIAHMTAIKDIMTNPPVTVNKKMGLQEVIKQMATTKISSILVTDDNEKLVGIVTERDLIKNILLPGKSVKKMKIDDVMTRDPITADAAADLNQVSQMMRDKNIRHLPVMENGKLAGMLTQTDIVKETHKIVKENVRYNKYLNIQVIIVLLLFLFLGAYVWWAYF
jgi:CBS domain-containing protein